MAGRICRIFRNVETLPDGSPNADFQPGKPILWTEYLTADGELGAQRFTAKKEQAIVFPSHGAADDRAQELREKVPSLGYIFGVSCAPPEISRLAGLTERTRRSRRKARLEGELRDDDLRQLEEEEIYG